jgi:two-component system, sensor histidine kinase PdtaS
VALRRVVRLDLPRRLARLLPRWLTELLVAIAATGAFVGVRLMATPWLGGNAPFPLATLAMVLSALLAGWRSGAMSLAMGLALIWYFVVPHENSFILADGRAAFTLIVALFAEVVILATIALYQREVRAGQIERARRINFLGHALREMDHRTKNNFQIVTSLLVLQAARSPHEEVQSALKEAAERLKAVAAVYDALAPSSQGLATVHLQDQLQEIADQIRRGILPEGIGLETELAPMLVPHETAVSIGIIVNELVTNACKHAFPDGAGTITIRTSKRDGAARIEVSDNGSGFVPGAKKGGLGNRLVAAFVKRVGGAMDVRSAPGAGTRHVVSIPLRQR